MYGPIIDIYGDPWSESRIDPDFCGCAEGTIFHEFLHLKALRQECKTYACTNQCFACAKNIPRRDQFGNECLEKDEYGNFIPNKPKFPCKDPNGDGPRRSPPSRPCGDHPDDNYSVASLRPTDGVSESRNPELLVLRNGFWEEAGSFINRLKRRFSYIEPDQSPLEMKDPPPILFIPSGGLYGMEKSSQFKSILEDYVSRGGTIIVFAQQHGYDFSPLPTPDGVSLVCYGWREDQSCRSNSVYVDTWHPALSSTTKSLTSSPIDGYFAYYPPDSTALLSRRINGMPAMLAYPYGEGRVVVTSMFEDWGNSHGQSTIQGRSIIRDLITWAKNPDLEILEYNLRNNPDPEVKLNIELKNLSDKTASEAKILWLDPDRNLYFEEETPISIPPGEETTIPVSHSFSGITDKNLGIWHTDYILYDSEGDEIQPQGHKVMR